MIGEYGWHPIYSRMCLPSEDGEYEFEDIDGNIERIYAYWIDDHDSNINIDYYKRWRKIIPNGVAVGSDGNEIVDYSNYSPSSYDEPIITEIGTEDESEITLDKFLETRGDEDSIIFLEDDQIEKVGDTVKEKVFILPMKSLYHFLNFAKKINADRLAETRSYWYMDNADFSMKKRSATVWHSIVHNTHVDEVFEAYKKIVEREEKERTEAREKRIEKMVEEYFKEDYLSSGMY